MFKNEALLNFTEEKNIKAYKDALTTVKAKISAGQTYACPIINGNEIRGMQVIDSFDPSTGISMGKVYLGSLMDAEHAVESIRKGSYRWERTPAETRAECLRKMAAAMRRRKFELAAIITLEEGKPWFEADADVAEAIDFCEYYAAEMVRLAAPLKTEDVPNEDNFYFYQPRGSVVVISPWNFPLAIACGMTVAALVTGNSTILKPARQSSIIAYELARIILESGVPSDAFAFLPSPGGQVGAFLASHKDVDMIAFTGSKEVGLDLIKMAGTVGEGQRNVKKVIAEMGGKNAVIVDEDADVEAAVKGTLASAFGYAGQKCSACSRLIVVGNLYEEFLSRLVAAAAKVPVGAAEDPATVLGPVIDEASQKRILGVIADAEKNIPVAFKGTCPSSGYFVPPVIFRDVPEDAFIWQEEIFGPLLSARKAASFDEGLDLANASAYALTGGVFSRNKVNLEKAKREFKVGNLYINRKITGALVCRQPFGGFRMSGIGSKAGGIDYLLQFMEPRTVTEFLG